MWTFAQLLQSKQVGQSRSETLEMPGYYTLSHTEWCVWLDTFTAFNPLGLKQVESKSDYLATVENWVKRRRKLQKIVRLLWCVWMATQRLGASVFQPAALVRCTAANWARNSLVNTSLSNEPSDSASKNGLLPFLSVLHLTAEAKELNSTSLVSYRIN